jgi:hypothetical protein
MNENSQPAASPATAAGAGPAALRSLTRNALGQIVAQLDGREPVVDVRVARCFPWTLPDTYISLRDSLGKELALLKTLDELDAASRQLVEQELREKAFSPRIQAVLDYKDEFGVVSISARTDRGDVTFQIRSRDDIRLLSPTRALFRDADGNTYELPDLAALDAASRRYLEEYF